MLISYIQFSWPQSPMIDRHKDQCLIYTAGAFEGLNQRTLLPKCQSTHKDKLPVHQIITSLYLEHDVHSEVKNNEYW